MSQRRSPKQQGYTNRDIAVMATSQLGGALHFVHMEDIAMKAAELSPRRFCWKRYPDQVNLELVRYALKDELRVKNKRVLGSMKGGWMLTPDGLSWCITTSNHANDDVLMDQIHQESDVAKRTLAFTKTLGGSGKDVSTADVEALLRVNEYFAERNRTERAVALANAAVLDPELRLVLDNLKKRGFKELEVRSE